MPRTPTGRPNGRPPKPIDLDEVRKLASLGCTIREIASWFSVANSTLMDREGFRTAYEQGQDEGKVSLRRAQMRAALAGNSRMLTWMGMQFLGQRNQTSTEVSGPDGGPIQTEDLSKLTNDELRALEQLLAKAKPDGPGESGTGPEVAEAVRPAGLACARAGDPIQ